MRRFVRLPHFILAMALVVALVPAAAAQQLFETRADTAMLIDAETGTVLFAKDPDRLIPPASLAKLMTMEVVFHYLKTGRLSMDDTFLVSENAWRTGGAVSGGSTMFAELGSSIRLEELIQGVIVQSANDGCIVIAEGLAGSEANFAQLMTQRAREIGLERSVFVNSTGLPAEGQLVTARELAQLAHHIWSEYPEFYRYYSQLEFTWNGILQRNRNPLLRMDIGADGMKTGYTQESGYGIVGSVERGDRRLFVALSGMTSESQRAEEARRVIDWGMRSFDRVSLFDNGQIIGEARMYGAEKSHVQLRADGPIALFVPVAGRDRMSARIVYHGPIEAPVEEGERIGSLRVWIGDTLSLERPLYAAETIEPGALHQRALDAVQELLVGWMR